jgi:two-component system, OmpR family, sensor histidine kinase KdpD
MDTTLRRVRALAWIAIPFAVALVTLAGRGSGANATTAGFLYLIAVLALATWGGWAVGAVASVAAMLCFNYFFFPPHGTLAIADPANWVALFSFLVASTVASRLVATARRQAAEAQRRQREVEILYEERERLLAEAAHLEAVRESDALKTSLLRAVSHDLRTPLTAMRLEIESLDWQLADRPEALASLRGLSLEQARLARRIDNLLALARLEAGLARPHPEDVPPSSLFRAAQEGLSLILAGRRVQVLVEPRCPDLWVDPSLALETVVNLLENAARFAPPDRPLELAASAAAAAPERVRVEVRDRGPGVPSGIRRLLESPRDLRRPEPGSGDSVSGGLGLRIAASFAEANGGALALLDRPGGGTVARLDLPAAPQPEEVEA